MLEEKDTLENSAEEKNSEAGKDGQPERQNDNDEQVETSQEDELSAVKKELESQKDKYLRLYADFENFKKRNIKERLDFLKLAGQEIIRDLLPVMDDFQR